MARWRRYAAPAAFLLVVTAVVLLVRPALRDESPPTKPTPTVRAVREYYRVKPGDTFSSIAAAHGLTVARLERLNPGVSSTSLFIGQRIRIG